MRRQVVQQISAGREIWSTLSTAYVESTKLLPRSIFSLHRSLQSCIVSLIVSFHCSSDVILQ